MKLTSAAIIGFNMSGIAFGANVAMRSKSIIGLANIRASGTLANNSTTTNTLTTAGAGINIKSDVVLFRGLDFLIYMDAQPGGALFYDAVDMVAILKVQKTAPKLDRYSTQTLGVNKLQY